MQNLIKTLAASIALTFGASAYAIPVTINFTVDNALVDAGICVDVGCTTILSPSDFEYIFADSSSPNAGDWTTASNVVLDLAPGTYGLGFVAQNSGDPTPTNPAGFLAEILWQGNSNLTSSAWEVTYNGTDWYSATEYYQNGDGIWGTHLIGEISSDAFWIWDDSSFSYETSPTVSFRTSITVTSVAEPGTLGLLGLGLLGVAMRRRRKSA